MLKIGDKDFIPQDLDRVTVYQCGPTVYAAPHIGNLRAAVVWDVLNRVLRRMYPEVVFVRNYTDIDDKIMNAAREEGVPISTITERAIAAYERDMAALFVIEPTLKPRVTDSISEIRDFITTLIESGHAYESEGHVLFDRTAYPEFFLNLNMTAADLQDAEKPAYKRSAADFVLWKPSTDDQPGWPSAWGVGRPGWHIECSAMIREHLGATIDLHVGGNDLKFPHHECECAQSHARNGVPLARYWAHNGMLQWVYDGEKMVSGLNGMRSGKMSKSLGNVLTLDDLLQEGYSPEAVRYFLLTAHYTQPLIFNDSRERIKACESSMKTLQRAMRMVGPMQPNYTYMDPLLDDLNTPRAIAKLHELANAIFAHRANDHQIEEFIGLADVMGLHENYEVRITDEVLALQMARSEARVAKDFARADQLRDQLIEMGVEVNDAPLRRG